MRKLFILLFLFLIPAPESKKNYLPIITTFCNDGVLQEIVNSHNFHETQLDFTTVLIEENSIDPNPFLDYSLTVKFKSPTGKLHTRPGFYNGEVYSVRFTPDEVGEYLYCAIFKEGENVAITNEGTQLYKFFGEINVTTNNNATGFNKFGKLVYTTNRYLKHINGDYFIKTGTNSPENFLAYSGFDNTYDLNGNFIHDYTPHGGIYGVLDYLESVGVNSIYFLPMNIGGDGQDTFPFLTPTALFNYDVSKLNQWNDVFNYAMSKGILLTFVLAEAEPTNVNYLGDFSIERRLFYKEMVARFGHHTVKWNIGEEQPYSIPQLVRYAEYLDSVDSYDKLITFHTRNNDTQAYQAVYNEEVFNISSQQLSPWNANFFTEKLRNETNWIVDIDEAFFEDDGLTCCNASYLRKETLYDVLFSGGNIEWYTDRDVTLENFAEYEEMWFYMSVTKNILQTVDFWLMEPADFMLTNESQEYGGGQVLHNINETLVYLPDASDGGTIHLNGRYFLTVFTHNGSVLFDENIEGVYHFPQMDGDYIYRFVRE